MTAQEVRPFAPHRLHPIVFTLNNSGYLGRATSVQVFDPHLQRQQALDLCQAFATPWVSRVGFSAHESGWRGGVRPRRDISGLRRGYSRVSG
jgi:hypothetical protein